MFTTEVGFKLIKNLQIQFHIKIILTTSDAAAIEAIATQMII